MKSSSFFEIKNRKNARIKTKQTEVEVHPQIKKLFWFVFAGTRGGISRINIISIIKDKPLNANQLSGDLGLDYKAIRHHIKVLEKNNLITKIGDKYGVTFSPSPLLESNIVVFDEIVSKMRVFLH